MGHSQYDPAMDNRAAWNAVQKVGAKCALKPRQIWAIRFFLDREGRMRDRVLFDLAIDSKLRGCDLVKIKIGELVAGPVEQGPSSGLLPVGDHMAIIISRTVARRRQNQRFIGDRIATIGTRAAKRNLQLLH